MSALANQKFNQLYLQGYQPTRMQEPEDPAHTMPPASRKQLKRLMLCPNS
jgi:hypothetical protein